MFFINWKFDWKRKRCFHSFAISSAHAARRFLTDIFVVFYSIWRLKNKCSDRSNGSLTSLPRLTNQPTSQPTDGHEREVTHPINEKIKLLRYRQYPDNFTKGLLLSQDQTHKIFIIPKYIYIFYLFFDRLWWSLRWSALSLAPVLPFTVNPSTCPSTRNTQQVRRHAR